MPLWVAPLIMYTVMAVVVMLLTRWLDDPYGHITNRAAWWQAICFGALWPLLFFYFFGVYLYFTWIVPKD